MSERIEATLDLTDCRYLGELHQRIKTALDFPDHYGENWDAFWDSLRFDSPVTYVKIVGVHTASKELEGNLDMMLKILQEFRETETVRGKYFEYEIVG